MANVSLIFSRPQVTTLPVRLVFGETDGPPAPAAVTLSGAGSISGLRLHIRASVAVRLLGQGSITGLRLNIAAKFDINVSRPTVGQVASLYQQARPAHIGLAQQYQQAIPTNVGARAHWQDAQHASAALRATWQQAETLAAWARTRFQEAAGLPTAPLGQRYQEADHLRAGLSQRFEEARRLTPATLTAKFQETIHLRAARLQRFEEAMAMGAVARAVQGYGLPSGAFLGGRYQEAWPPRPGQWVRPPIPGPQPCYLPVLPALLVFKEPAAPGLPSRLVFVCERFPGPADPEVPGATVVVPIRKVYVTVNSLTLVTTPGGDVINAASFGMSLDVDSWTWQWHASLAADALPLITPAPGGDPVQLVATVNGTPYRLSAEGYSRQRQFGSARISVRGRGRAAILDRPYAPVLNFGNAAARTAQQLANEALTINTVPIGWDIAWGLTDWLVPANAWTHQGTYISAILDIATAAGGYVQPHDTAATLRILPRYPAAPWDWAALTPDFELPAAVVSVEGTDWLQMPGYNRVHVAGTTVGVLGEVTRTGTAGDAVAPMVTHPLITHADAARQRGIAELSNTGRIANLSLRLPVLDETGVIKPGAFVRYIDAGVPQLGLVRSTQIEWSRPTLRQVLSVETHPELA